MRTIPFDAIETMEKLNFHNLLQKKEYNKVIEYTFKGNLNLHEIAGFFYDLKEYDNPSLIYKIESRLEKDYHYTFETFQGIPCTTIFVENEKTF